ncbi:MAG: YjfB family protein [Lachnospiraceae bacterium]|nr:YjfB family protein [Lachnospiraceae bacterium]
MDVARLSMAMAMNQTHQQVGVAMLKNSMDLMQAEGSQMAAMIAEAPAPALNPPGVGGSIDIRV